MNVESFQRRLHTKEKVERIESMGEYFPAEGRACGAKVLRSPVYEKLISRYDQFDNKISLFVGETSSKSVINI